MKVFIMIVVIFACGHLALHITEHVGIVMKNNKEDGTQKNGAKTMTRKEFHNKVDSNNDYISWHNAHELADALYSDFESRTCENCKYWDKRLRMCDNRTSFAYHYLATVLKTDGCNKFERKQ